MTPRSRGSHIWSGVTASHAAFVIACLTSTLAILQACRAGDDRSRSGSNGNVTLPTAGQLASVPLGDIAGIGFDTVVTRIVNPYHGVSGAVEEGRVLFEGMNCAACHGYTLGGGMGPNLTDTYWRYGGAPAQVYNSIFQGRPRGMPAWGSALSQADIWKLTAYIESYGGTFAAAKADQAKQGNLGDQGSVAASSLKGLNDDR